MKSGDGNRSYFWTQAYFNTISYSVFSLIFLIFRQNLLLTKGACVRAGGESEDLGENEKILRCKRPQRINRLWRQLSNSSGSPSPLLLRELALFQFSHKTCGLLARKQASSSSTPATVKNNYGIKFMDTEEINRLFKEFYGQLYVNDNCNRC